MQGGKRALTEVGMWLAPGWSLDSLLTVYVGAPACSRRHGTVIIYLTHGRQARFFQLAGFRFHRGNPEGTFNLRELP